MRYVCCFSVAAGFGAVHTSLSLFLKGLPLSIYALSAHNSVFPVFHEMKDKRVDVFKHVAIINYAIAFVLYVISGCVIITAALALCLCT